MAGGWAQAARLPAQVACAFAADYLKRERNKAYSQSVLTWASMLPAFAWGGTPPKPPDPPED